MEVHLRKHKELNPAEQTLNIHIHSELRRQKESAASAVLLQILRVP